MKRLMIALAAIAATPLCVQAQPSHEFVLQHGANFGDAMLSWPQTIGEDGHEMNCGVDGDGLRVAVMVPDRRFPTHDATVHLAGGGTDTVIVDAHGRQEPWRSPMIVVSGRARLTTRAEAEYPLDGEGPSANAVDSTGSLPLNRLFLSEFARTGRLTVTTLGYTQALPPVPRDMARRFVSLCLEGARHR